MAIAFVQQAGHLQAASTTNAATISTPTAGNCLVVFSWSNANEPSSISGGGVTWVRLKASPVNYYWAEVWYGLNSSGSGTTVTVTYASSTDSLITVAEFSGIKTSSAADASTDADFSNTSNPTTGPITASAGPCLYLAAIANTGSAPATPGNGFTLLTNQGPSSSRYLASLYRIDSGTPASATPSLTMSATAWETALGALQGTASTMSDPMGAMGFYGV